LRELALSLPALSLQAPDLALHPAELLLNGRHEPLDLLRAPGHLARGALLFGPALVGEALRQGVARLCEHVHGDRLELVAHTLAVGLDPHERDRARAAEQDSDDQQ